MPIQRLHTTGLCFGDYYELQLITRLLLTEYSYTVISSIIHTAIKACYIIVVINVNRFVLVFTNILIILFTLHQRSMTTNINNNENIIARIVL